MYIGYVRGMSTQNSREETPLTRVLRRILSRMDAGLYYPWHLGYNDIIEWEDDQ